MQTKISHRTIQSGVILVLPIARWFGLYFYFLEEICQQFMGQFGPVMWLMGPGEPMDHNLRVRKGKK